VPTSGSSADDPWITSRACGESGAPADAAHALCDALNTLGIFAKAWEERPTPKADGIREARRFFAFGVPDGPAERAYQDPGTVFLLINPPPMLTNSNKKAQKTK
jgi:hypothetical protein